MKCCHLPWVITRGFYSRLSIQMHAIAIHRASISDNRVYIVMLTISNAESSKCPELPVLAVRPVTHSGVRSMVSVASMVAMLPWVL